MRIVVVCAFLFLIFGFGVGFVRERERWNFQTKLAFWLSKDGIYFHGSGNSQTEPWSEYDSYMLSKSFLQSIKDSRPSLISTLNGLGASASGSLVLPRFMYLSFGFFWIKISTTLDQCGWVMPSNFEDVICDSEFLVLGVTPVLFIDYPVDETPEDEDGDAAITIKHLNQTLLLIWNGENYSQQIVLGQSNLSPSTYCTSGFTHG